MPEPKQVPSWEAYGYHAMAELERFSEVMEKMSEQIDEIQETQAEAKGSARMLGSIYGFAVVALVEAAKAFFSWVAKPR